MMNRKNYALASAVVNADGSTRLERFTAQPDASIDCFYVYPTASLDMTPNSATRAGDCI